MKNGVYIYGIISGANSQQFGAIGIGNEAAPVVCIGYQDLAAVVSHSPLVVYDSLTKEQAIKDLITHQSVMEKVMERCTIMPVKFGTMVETEEQVVKFLEKGHALLSSELPKIEQKIELDVVASWDLVKILVELSQQHSEIQQKQNELALRGGNVSLEDQVALGTLIEEALHTKKLETQRLILQKLSGEGVAVCQHETVIDDMILNAAFLLDKQQEEAFQQLVHSLDQELAQTVNFRVVGPLPPYSFATVLLENIDARTLEEAKATLGLKEEITEKTLHDTYHQLAKKSHPDTKKEEETLHFHRLHTAYNILKNFIEHGLMRVELYQWQKDVQEK